jgi:WS/DGAT/MGAT family acyltransferase
MILDQSLSPLDAAFLYVESDRTPMHMATVALFEAGPLEDENGKVRIDELRRLISSRLDLVPKLRQKAHPGLMHEAPPVWMDDPTFDISQHVRCCRLAEPGTEQELGRLCGEILAAPLDRSRPLWELIFVDGLSDHRIGLVEKLHHSMADGLAAAELATVLLDLSPHVETVDHSSHWVPSASPSVVQGTARDLLRLGELSIQVAAWGGWTLLHPIRRAKGWLRTGRAIGTLLGPRTIAPRSPLNAQIGPTRQLHFVRLRLDQVRDVAHFNNATINDAALTIVAGGLHELLERRGDLTADSELQALVPVGLEIKKGRGLANKVSAYFVRLPVGVEDPVSVLREVSLETKRNKAQHQELAAGIFLQLLEPLPQSLLARGAGLIQHQPFFNLIVTNVPGPTIPLYVLGAKLLEAFPIVPLAGNQGLGVAALSYEGQLNLGVFSDPTICPDIEAFCYGARSTFRDLVESCGVGR